MSNFLPNVGSAADLNARMDELGRIRQAQANTRLAASLPLNTDRVTGVTQQGRRFVMTVAVGACEEDYTVLHFLGEVEFRGQYYTVSGQYELTVDRSRPASFFRLDTGEAMTYASDDLLHGVFMILDQQDDGIVQRQHSRLG